MVSLVRVGDDVALGIDQVQEGRQHQHKKDISAFAADNQGEEWYGESERMREIWQGRWPNRAGSRSVAGTGMERNREGS